MKNFVFGASRCGLPILAHQFGSNGPKILVMGGVHGDEREGLIASHLLLQRFSKSFSFKMRLTLIPCFNIDGLIHNQRGNGNGVDLNRNLPTSDWNEEFENERYRPGPSPGSEPESQALIKFFEENRIDFVLSLHSWKPLLNTNGPCEQEAEVIARHTGYEIKNSIGYPTPGCLGTYCGLERDIPTLTYEFEKQLAVDKIQSIHVPAILEALKITENRG